MNSRGQAALEYLMTYGWALIVIAIVVGVLVFIVSSPAGNIVCNSNDPAKIMVKASQINSNIGAGTAAGTIKITNLTGGNITVNGACFGGGGFTTPVDGCPPGTVTSGAEIILTPKGADSSGSPYGISTIGIHYTDYASLQRDANITCSGPLTIS